MEAATSCTFTDEGTEAFGIAYNSTTKKHTYTVADKSSGEYYYDHVAALTLPSDVGNPTPTRNWDCATAGETVTSIDVSDVNFATCDALAKEGFDSSDHSSCEEQEGADRGTDSKNIQ
jgi:hypothetical protein